MQDSDSPPPAASPHPLPVQTLDYRPPTSPRPGILTAVGIVSIVIGTLSALTGCWGAASAGMFLFMPRAVPVAPAPAPAPAAGGGGAAFSAVSFTPVTDPWTMIPSLADGVLRLGLALLLIAAGVLVLREHPLGRKLHLIWAWVKIPAALLSAAASWHMTSRMFASMPATSGVPAKSIMMGMLVGIGFQLFLAWAYPIAVLIVMRTRTVRNYYATRFGGPEE